MTQPQIDIVVVSDPDSGASITAYVNGEPVEPREWHIDAGAGHTAREWNETRDTALDATTGALREQLSRLYADPPGSQYISEPIGDHTPRPAPHSPLTGDNAATTIELPTSYIARRTLLLELLNATQPSEQDLHDMRMSLWDSLIDSMHDNLVTELAADEQTALLTGLGASSLRDALQRIETLRIDCSGYDNGYFPSSAELLAPDELTGQLANMLDGTCLSVFDDGDLNEDLRVLSRSDFHSGWELTLTNPHLQTTTRTP